MDIISFFQGLNFDQWSAIIFVLILSAFCYFKRDKIKVQKLIGFLVYIIMYRTKIGIKFMDRLAKRFNEEIKLFGYIAIGLGFLGMIFVSIQTLMLFFGMVFKPQASQAGFALVLPFTNVTGVGYLSFWHFIIALFIIAVIHEFAHGVVAKAHGLKIKSTGFAIFGLVFPAIPAAFVEPDEKEMKKKSDVVQYSIFAAGPVINILLALALLMIFPFAADLTNSTLAPFEDRISEPAGISVQLVNETLPAALSGMPNQTIISHVNDVKIESYSDFVFELLRVRPGDNVSLVSNNETYIVETVPNPNDEKRAFVGVMPQSNERTIKEGVPQGLASFFYWLKGLIKWLVLLNFGVGLINLLPLGPVDGGRMLAIVLDRTVKDEKKAKKIWGFIALMFLFIILFSVIIDKVGNPFLLLR